MYSLALVSSGLCLLANSVLGDSVYPQKAPGDAPYSVDEATLRAAITLPADFSHGAKLPVILAPGTGNTGAETYAANFFVLLSNSTAYDPIPLEIPGNLLNDCQVNAEFVAYAINYVSSISNNAQVSVITWSQGSIDMQWALKYWPSTRPVVDDFVAVSGDIHGTIIASAIEPVQGLIPLPPSLIQQESNSEFIATLLNPNGASALVTTTSVYSSTDEVVQPQTGTAASGFFGSANGIAATNYEVQTICAGLPAGGVYTHEGMLYNPFTYAIAIDAFTHAGPGESSRLDLSTVCSTELTPGLNVADQAGTESDITVAATNIAAYPVGERVTVEPAIMAYARGDVPVGAKPVKVRRRGGRVFVA